MNITDENNMPQNLKHYIKSYSVRRHNYIGLGFFQGLTR